MASVARMTDMITVLLCQLGRTENLLLKFYDVCYLLRGSVSFVFRIAQLNNQMTKLKKELQYQTEKVDEMSRRTAEESMVTKEETFALVSGMSCLVHNILLGRRQQLYRFHG